MEGEQSGIWSYRFPGAKPKDDQLIRDGSYSVSYVIQYLIKFVVPTSVYIKLSTWILESMQSEIPLNEL